MNALSSLMFIVEKRDGRVKARTCAFGSKQRTFPGYSRLDWASPTFTTNEVVITSTIEAHEGRDVMVDDLMNVFLNTNNSEKTLMILKGNPAELMVQINSQMYRK